MSFILTKGIVFVNDAPTPRYAISAYGKTEKPVLVSLEGEPSSLYLNIGVPIGTRFVVVEHIRTGSACAWNSDVPVSETHSIGYSKMIGGGNVLGRRVDIMVPTSVSAFEEDALYGSYSKVLYIRCNVEWEPKQESFASYALKIANDYSDDVRQKSSHAHELLGNRTLPIAVSAYKLNDSRLLTLAGKGTGQDDERLLIPGDYAVVDWKPENGTEERDALFVMIGAFIALGAAVLIEGLRPLVELAIDSNYANSSGDFD